MTPVLSVVGASGSGKTTLLEALIGWLIERGHSVAVLKHDAHRFQIDHPGKDTARLFDAGATQVAIAGADEIALRERPRGAIDPESLVRRLFHDVDLVLTEGYRCGPWPKLEVARAGHGPGPAHLDDPTLVALATDLEVYSALPAFALDDVASLGAWIESRFLSSAAGEAG